MKSDLEYYLSKIGGFDVLTREDEKSFFDSLNQKTKLIWEIIVEIFLKGSFLLDSFDNKHKKKYKEYFLLLNYINKFDDKSINRIHNYAKENNLNFKDLDFKDEKIKKQITNNFYDFVKYPINFEFFLYLKKVFSKINNKTLSKEIVKFNNLLERIDSLRNDFTKANLKLVISISKKYINLPLPWVDTIQEGNIGLFKAIERFDINLGNKFSTYASWWIKQSIIRAVIEKERTIKIPIHMLDKLSKIKKVMLKYLSLENRIPSLEEIAKDINMDVEKIESILEYSSIRFVSFNSPINKNGNDSETFFEEIIEDTRHQKTIERLEQEEIAQLINKKLDNLTEIQRKVVILKYGLNGKNSLTLSEISNKLNLSTERIRQIQLKALFKLKKNINKRNFKKLLG